MRLLSVLAASLLVTSSAIAAAPGVDLRVDRSSGRALYSLSVIKAPLQRVATEIAAATRRTVTVDAPSREIVVSVNVADASEERMLESVAAAAGLWWSRRGDTIRFQTTEPTASVDVKDEDVRSVLRSLQEQCGVRNLVIDPAVTGKGTFLFRDVPCRQAFSVVFSSFGLNGEFTGRSVGTIAPR